MHWELAISYSNILEELIYTCECHCSKCFIEWPVKHSAYLYVCANINM